jgi:hypothetical protein
LYDPLATSDDEATPKGTAVYCDDANDSDAANDNSGKASNDVEAVTRRTTADYCNEF